MKQIFDKQGKLQSEQEYFKRQMEMREQGVIEQLFKDVLQATSEVAKEKGFDLVLEKSEPELPAASSNELKLTISTHKVLFNSGCEDITDAVMAKIDAAEKPS
jgi:Skp family chaperone for outer membrane proteins